MTRLIVFVRLISFGVFLYSLALHASPMQDLKNGNQRFAEGKPKHPAQTVEVRRKLAEDQEPPVIVLSCSDSRVPPELVFDQGLGELFTVRVAGNIVDPATAASIEYAVEHFGSSLIVVLGHDSCGAVKAALDTPKDKSAGSKDLDELVRVIRDHLHDHDQVPPAEKKTLRSAVHANVVAVVDELIKRSKIIRERVNEGKLSIAPAIYELRTGKVLF